MTSGWKVLPIASPGPNSQTLLYKYDIGATNYTICVTDLTKLWVEDRDRKQIIKKAWDVDASIDPSEGIDQLQLLLNKLQTSLEGNEKTSLDLLAETNSDHNIDLKVTIPLPSSLRPLEWIFNLELASATVFSAKFIKPCFEHLLYSRYQASSLIGCLKAKDHVIGKLLDKIQSFGIDMNAVFPNAPIHKGPKQFSRDSVGSSVKGLSNFNEEEWLNSLDPVFKPGLKKDDFLSCNTSLKASLDLYKQISNKSRPKHDNLQSQSSEPLTSKQVDSPRVVDDSMTEVSMEDQCDEPAAFDDSTSSEEDDLDKTSIPHKTLAHRSQESKPESTSKQLRTIGESSKVGQGSEHRDEPTKSLDQPEPEQTFIPEPAPNVPLKEKLGKIGGKAQHGQFTAQSANHVSVTRSNPKHIADQSSSSLPSDDESRGRKIKGKTEEKESKVSVSPSPVRETSEERADRRRLELKRELEEKSKAPVKKKRKF